jgi:dsDNA-binding SOS-regulon protein
MAKIVQIQMFEANDGSQFATAAEADAYDFMLENKAVIDAAAEAFVNSTKRIDRARVTAANLVGEFLAFYIPWKDAGCPEVERIAFDTPKPEKVVEVDTTAKAEDAAPTEEVVVAGEEELFPQ